MKQDFIYIFQNPAGQSNHWVRRFRVSARLHEFLQEYSRIFARVEIPRTTPGIDRVSKKQIQKIGKAMLTHSAIAQSPGNCRLETARILGQENLNTGAIDLTWKLAIEMILSRKNLDTNAIDLKHTWSLAGAFLEGGDLEIKEAAGPGEHLPDLLFGGKTGTEPYESITARSNRAEPLYEEDNPELRP